MTTQTLQEKAFATNLLVPEVHGRIVADIESVARQAGIPMHLIWTSATEHCLEQELEFTRKLHTHAEEGVYGFVYLGKKHQTPVHMRMMALAGACIRNFINAKVMTVQDVLTALKKDTMPKPTVLFIPNFFIAKENGGSIPEWQLSGLLGLLMNRQSEGLQTYLYVDSMKDMAAQYGDAFDHHISNYFVRCAE